MQPLNPIKGGGEERLSAQGKGTDPARVQSQLPWGTGCEPGPGAALGRGQVGQPHSSTRPCLPLSFQRLQGAIRGA